MIPNAQADHHTVSTLEEQEAAESTNRPSSLASPLSPTAPSLRASRLATFLDDLAIRPNDPPFDVNDTGYRKSLSGSGFLTGSASSNVLGSLASTSNTPPRNPEADSFTYIETLLEALAVLGKLGTGLDIVAQKLPNEIFSLIEATVEEVSERAEYGRRGSMNGMVDSANATAGRPADLSFLSGPTIASNALGIAGVAVVTAIHGSSQSARRAIMDAACLRLTTLESSTKVLDQEILRDFFWTLYSKLIAVSDGLRVVYEVANRIGSVRFVIGNSPTSIF